MATGFGRRAPEPDRPAAPFLLRHPYRSGAPAAIIGAAVRLRPHEAIARWICGEVREAATTDGGPVLDRRQIAAALGFRLVRVKRSLALLSLSGVLECTGDTVSVRDWVRLCGIARIAPAELGIRPVEQIEAEAILVLQVGQDELAPDPVKTAAGEPACFV